MVLAPKVHSGYLWVKARALFSFVLGTKNILCGQNSQEQIRRTQSGKNFCTTSLVELAKQRWQKIIRKINCALGIYNFFIFTNFIKTIYYCCEKLGNKLYIFTVLDWSLLNNSLVEVIFFSLDIVHFFHLNKSYLNYLLFLP